MLRVTGFAVHLGPLTVSAHFLFESLAYAAGFALYRRDRALRGDVLRSPDRNSVIVAAILGAAFGSKLLGALEDPGGWMRSLWPVLLGGKTVVGGLVGGTIAVEWVKRRLQITERTGDLFAVPITLAIAIGRIGCFFGGLGDHTYGVATSVPWAVDFGDGVPRHPTQIYEALFLVVLAGFLRLMPRGRLANGDLYRIFLFCYVAWRFAVDFLKPDPTVGGLSAIQWVSGAALLWYARDIVRIASAPRKLATHG
ncbi:MAG TPA: prolipoprotein diacylglyceryl transferase family protein [Bryobacteraceae bacterium]|nr:prolipoprotein diacylglyceryl transferase family protein [Bryobacteraceae bacterium]